MPGRVKLLPLLMAVIVGAAACGGSSSSTSSPSGRAAHPKPAEGGPKAQAVTGQGMATITIQGTGFGAPQTVNPGEPIHLVNQNAQPYTVTSGSAIKVSVGANATATFTAPTIPGSYPLHTTGSNPLNGTLTVQGV